MPEPTLFELAGPAPDHAPGGRLAGKVCLVSGATAGIGRATAIRMAREGAAAVVIGGRRADHGAAVVAEIDAAGSAGLFVRMDVTQEEDAARFVDEALRRFGRIDAVFNNAGYQEKRAPLAEQADEIYQRVFDTNVRALVHALRHQIPALRASGGGAIVNNTSVSGVRNPNPGLALYSASKAAAISLTRSAALEYAPEGIRINGIAPGRVATEMMLNSGIADMRLVAAGLPLRRMGHPEEVAAAVCWLLSAEASFVVGHILCADGGFLSS